MNLNLHMFKEMSFPEEVLQIIENGVPINYLGERDVYEQVDQYRFPNQEARDACVEECERALACKALVPPPFGVAVTKVHSWVVVLKGGRTRVCLDCSTQ